MKKYILSATTSLCLAHPVPYSIDLTAVYNESKSEVSVTCKSDSKNKCGLHNFDILDKNDKKIVTKKFPFLKEKITFPCSQKPYKMVFFLRKIPEHQYKVYFELILKQ